MTNAAQEDRRSSTTRRSSISCSGRRFATSGTSPTRPAASRASGATSRRATASRRSPPAAAASASWRSSPASRAAGSAAPRRSSGCWTMVRFLLKADSYHGIWPHFLNGDTGRTIPFSRKDDGSDLVETSFLIAGLLCARQYFDARGRGRNPAPRRDRLAVGGGRMELAHAGRPQRALLALEPEQRLEHEPRDPRLERVPDHLRAGRLGPALSDLARGLSSRLGRRPRLPQRPHLRRHHAAARAGRRRPAVPRRNIPSSASTRAASRTATPTTGSRTSPTP